MIRNVSILLVSAALVLSPVAFASGGGEMGGGGMGGGEIPSMGVQGPSPAELETAYNAGVTAVNASDWKTAVKKFSFVTENASDNVEAWNYLGYSQRKGGNAKKSETAYKKALKLDANSVHANEYYGELLVELNRIPEAEQRLAVMKACCASDPGVATLSDFIAKAKANTGAAALKPSAGY